MFPVHTHAPMSAYVFFLHVSVGHVFVCLCVWGQHRALRPGPDTAASPGPSPAPPRLRASEQGLHSETVQWKSHVSQNQMDLSSKSSSPTYQQYDLGQVSCPLRAWLLGLLRSLSEIWLYQAFSKCPVSAGPLLWVSYVWWGRGN